jgi:hypothetical protein
MSIEIILVPLAVAAYGSWKARSIQKENVLVVETRLKDSKLLAQALGAMGGSSIEIDGSKVEAVISKRRVSFSPNIEGILTAHVDTNDKDEAIGLLVEVDRQYGLQVQTAVLQRVKDRADRLGMNIVSQIKDDDGSVSILLEEVEA